MGASGLPEIESHFKKQEKDSDDAQAKSKKKSTEEEKKKEWYIEILYISID